jgi:hypothetical protein
VKTPRELVAGVKVNYHNDLRSPFGTIGLFKVPNQSKNQTTESRVQLGIVVGRDLQVRGSVKVFLVDSKQVVNRNHFQQIKASDSLIITINEFADKDLQLQSNDVIDLDYELKDIQEDDIEEDTNKIVIERDEDSLLDDINGDSSNKTASYNVDDPVIIENIITNNNNNNNNNNNHSIHNNNNINTSHDSNSNNVDAHVEEKVIEETLVKEPSRYSFRDRTSISKPSRFSNAAQCIAMNLSVKQALKKHGTGAREAIAAEFRQLNTRKVWRAIHSSKSASDSKHKKIIPSSMFIKEKFDARGIFDKLKARFCAGGHRVETELYSMNETASPTIAFESLLLVLSIAAFEGRDAEAIDFPGAYLYATLKDKQLMRIGSDLADIAVEVNPSLKKYLQQDKSLLVELDKALYGLPESAKLWFDHLCKFLISIGYSRSTSDPCLFNKEKYNEKSTLCIHVDDILHTFTGYKLQRELSNHLKKQFINETKVQESKNGIISYLGMAISFNKQSRSISCTMPGYIKDILNMFDDENNDMYEAVMKLPVSPNIWKGNASTPANSKLFEINPDALKIDKSIYLSIIMKIMYLSNRTRHDLKLALSFLATRAKDPTIEDIIKLARVIRYIRSSIDLPLTFQPDELRLYAFVDASYAVHPDAKGHTGIIISMGINGGPIYTKSTKQKLVSRSSTESELIALTECVSHIIWMRSTMESLGLKQHAATIIYEDNTSTIHMANSGKGGKTGNTRHINVRFFFCKENIDNGEIEVRYISTEEQRADLLTKPLQGSLFLRHRSTLLNHAPVN